MSHLVHGGVLLVHVHQHPRAADSVQQQALQDAPSLRKQLLIESRWVPKPLAFAGQLRPRRLNNYDNVHEAYQARVPPLGLLSPVHREAPAGLPPRAGAEHLLARRARNASGTATQ
jgi:hypothetical protein|eukprot:COSAG01_NODE_455_length_16792_cov_112.440424_12_plen_116_part_00